MHKDPDTYRLKALAAEQMAREFRDPEVRKQWAELAIEWHLLASVAGAMGSQPKLSDSNE